MRINFTRRVTFSGPERFRLWDGGWPFKVKRDRYVPDERRWLISILWWGFVLNFDGKEGRQ